MLDRPPARWGPSYVRGIPREWWDQPRGASGERFCRWCWGLVVRPRLTFCSEACVHEWKIRSSGDYARAAIFARDRGVCADCHTDTIAGYRPVLFDDRRLNYGFRQHPEGLWEADHILPVAEGGGSAGLENLQTLCSTCHKRKTAEQAARAAERRRRAKEAHGGKDRLHEG